MAGRRDEGEGAPAAGALSADGSGRDAFRERLLQGLLTTALLLLTVATPVIVVQTRIYERAAGLVLAASIYAAVLVGAFGKRLPYRMRALLLLIGLGALPVSGLLRVGFQVGPGVGCALVVVAAGLLLGPRALWIAFGTTLLSILAIGIFHAQTKAAWLAHETSDPTLLANWLRVAVAYVLFTGVLATAVMYVVQRIERALLERTRMLDQLRDEQAQRAQTEHALDHAQATIIQMQKLEAVGRLAGGVAHDFNNALVVILGWADALPRLRDDAAKKRALDEIIAAGSRAARLTRQLLAIGRKAVSTPEAVQPHALLSEITGFLERVLPENIQLRTEVADDTPAIWVDPGQAHQVFLNLCLNARDAMPYGGQLTIAARACASPDAGDSSSSNASDRWVALSVQDTGIGMDAATLENMFEPFFTTKGELGTGLGLATVHSITTQNGGSVRVQSALGVGSTFTVYLPPATDTRGGMAGGVVPKADEPAPRSEPGATVLIAEDEPAVREVMAQALREAGHAVLTAPDGNAALELARRHRGRIDLLCTDGIMPGISSDALIASFRHLFPSAAILVCSGHVRDDALRARVSGRQVCYLEKPFTAQALTAAVDGALRASAPTSQSSSDRA